MRALLLQRLMSGGGGEVQQGRLVGLFQTRPGLSEDAEIKEFDPGSD